MSLLIVLASLFFLTFTGLFMVKMAGFAKLFFPVFRLGAVFGKVIELSGFSEAMSPR